MDLWNRYFGCLVGLAVGDALGVTVEFMPRGTFEPVNDMVGGGPFRLNPGEWTDDTSMALCLAESLAKKQKFDSHDQMERYLRWWKFGHLSSNGTCFDIGNTVRSALRKYKQNGEPYSGSTNPRSAGNGSIMRLAPVPMYYRKNPKEAVFFSGESSKTTHGAQTCIDACRYMGALIVGALNGEKKEALLSPFYSPAPGVWKETPFCPEISKIIDGSYKEKKPEEIMGSGYVVESLEAALWAFSHSSSFDEGCLLAVNLGDDSDTTGAVYGQIAGAFYGYNEIRRNWREKIARPDVIEKFARSLYNSNGS